MTLAMSNFVFENRVEIFLAAVLVLLLGSVLAAVVWDRRASILKYLEHRREVRIERGIAMGRKQKAAREAYVLSLLADIVTDGLEEAWFAGKITDDERNWAYRKIGNRGVHDVVPKRTLAQVKSIIKGRRYRGSPSPAQQYPAWGEPTPKPPKPGQPQAAPPDNIINAKKRFGDKALSRLAKPAA